MFTFRAGNVGEGATRRGAAGPQPQLEAGRVGQLEEEHVGLIADHGAHRDGADFAVVVLPPLRRVRVPAVGRVVARVQCTQVVGHTVQAVLTGSLSIRVRGQVQSTEGKVDHAVQLAPAPLLRREPLQVNHQDARELLDGETLSALLPLLSLGARRFLVAVEHLLFGEEVEAGRSFLY